jgi:cell division protein FtsZ
MGKAMMGTGEASGEKRAIEAAEAAISNPLLDDCSMRGARGLLISITGGPDLTLYEVDEAATRIREEVDPEANIILGATFDDSLEGTMRVSVVATGLAKEAGEAFASSEDDMEQPETPSRPVFGYTGKQPIPVKKPIVQTAPPAVARMPSPSVQVAQQPATPAVRKIEEAFESEPAAAADPTPVQHQTAASRIPPIEQFPPIAQRQIAAQQTRIESIAEHAKKKKGLLERLASVGLGRKDDMPAGPKEPQIAQRAEPKIQPAQQAPRTAAAPAAPIDPTLDDDQLEIPAFLRRQAN